jgi:hypothetical protein
MDIDVWYGDSSTDPCGPIKGKLIKHNPSGESEIQIVDKSWLDNMGWDDDYFYKCKKLPDNYYVSYDDYCWSYPGECTLNNKWW